jgi:cytochrome c oxidase subunit I+III
MRLLVCPPPGAALPDLTWALASGGLLVASSVLMLLAVRALGKRRLPWQVLTALGCAAASFVVDLYGHGLAGLDPTASAWGAAIGALLGYQGMHIVLLAIAGPYLCLRAWRGMLGERSRATLDNVALIWHYTTLQGIAGMALVHILPRLMPWLME